MKRLRRLLLILALCGLIASVVLLLNITAPNPTGRRYSSAPVQVDGAPQAKGDAGETRLALDLGVPNNNTNTARYCVCGTAHQNHGLPADCRVCVAYVPEVSTYRRPDFFVEGRFMAEAKNVQALRINSRDHEQIQAFAAGAKLAGIPLWLYVRLDSRVDAGFYDLVEATGGGIVPYFTVEGYSDPIDEAARLSLFVSVGIVAGVWLIPAWFIPRRIPRPRPAPRPDLITRTQRKINDADDFAARIHDRYEDI